MPETTVEQKVHIRLWLDICGMFRTDKGLRVSMRYLGALEHLSLVHNYD